ncbi:hypothetical protein PVAND_015141 [Polypedilum vanderplanki]|uniref:Odorant binding protein n=1 Tax=Polypedilum vanderplanki TaxID=319348 RepID=A0A9J6BC60_POLVA|nr:hypothetical protein PVAND_015141 [Polypedilum vanderplanki]
MMATLDACKITTGATDADIAKLMIHEKPETQEGKCLANCLYESMGLLKDGKLSKEGFLTWGKILNTDDAHVKVLAECEDESDPDVCESGMKIGYCLKLAASKHNLQFEH